MLRIALLCLVSLSAYHTYGEVDDAVNARLYEYIAGDNESMCSVPQSLRKAHLRVPMQTECLLQVQRRMRTRK